MVRPPPRRAGRQAEFRNPSWRWPRHVRAPQRGVPDDPLQHCQRRIRLILFLQPLGQRNRLGGRQASPPLTGTARELGSSLHNRLAGGQREPIHLAEESSSGLNVLGYEATFRQFITSAATASARNPPIVVPRAPPHPHPRTERERHCRERGKAKAIRAAIWTLHKERRQKYRHPDGLGNQTTRTPTPTSPPRPIQRPSDDEKTAVGNRLPPPRSAGTKPQTTRSTGRSTFPPGGDRTPAFPKRPWSPVADLRTAGQGQGLGVSILRRWTIGRANASRPYRFPPTPTTPR